MPSRPESAVKLMQVGPHQVNVELPDILHLRLNGDVELEHFQAFYGAMVAIPPDTGVYVLRDARHGGVVSAKARKYMAQNANMTRVAALVTYGASFHARTVLTMVSRALRLINAKVPTTVFFETEAEARTWIAEHRAVFSDDHPESSRRP